MQPTWNLSSFGKLRTPRVAVATAVASGESSTMNSRPTSAIGQTFERGQALEPLDRISAFTRCHFTGCDLAGRDLRGATFTFCEFDEVSFAGVDATFATFTSCRFEGCDWSGAKLYGSLFGLCDGLWIEGAEIDDLTTMSYIERQGAREDREASLHPLLDELRTVERQRRVQLDCDARGLLFGGSVSPELETLVQRALDLRREWQRFREGGASEGEIEH